MNPAGENPASARHGEMLDLETASLLSGMPRERILELAAWSLTSIRLDPDPSRTAFDLHAIHLMRRIEALRDDYQLEPAPLRLVAELLDRLEAAERELRILRERER